MNMEKEQSNIIGRSNIWTAKGILAAVPGIDDGWKELSLFVPGLLPEMLIPQGLGPRLPLCSKRPIGTANMAGIKVDGALRLNTPVTVDNMTPVIGLLCTPELAAQSIYILSDKRLLAAYLSLMDCTEIRTMLDKVTMGVSRVLTEYADGGDEILPIPDGTLQKAADNAASLQCSLLELILSAKSNGGAQQAEVTAYDTMPMFLHMAFSLVLLGTILVHTVKNRYDCDYIDAFLGKSTYNMYTFTVDGYDKALEAMKLRMCSMADAMRNAIKNNIL